MVDGIGKQLGLDDRRLAPSRNTLKWFGNTSSSTVWYSLAYVEACQGVAPGDRAWQVCRRFVACCCLLVSGLGQPRTVTPVVFRYLVT